MARNFRKIGKQFLKDSAAAANLPVRFLYPPNRPLPNKDFEVLMGRLVEGDIEPAAALREHANMLKDVTQ